MTIEADGWLTAVRIRRLHVALAAIRTHPPPGVPEDRINRVIWNRCDGPLNDVPHLVDVLVGSGLLERRGTLICQTKRGRTVATQDHQSGGRLLARALVDAGYFRSQTRRLLAAGVISDEGDLLCARAAAVRSAAQLTGVLRLWGEVTLDTSLRVPARLVQELLADWSLQPIPWRPDEATRREVGDRAEAYTYQWEREKSDDPSSVHWVSLDDDTLGYDIENADRSPPLHIEVKGSQGRETRFVLTSNEWKVGHKLKDAYEIQFWGEISIARPRAEEYRTLLSSGYPRVFRDLGEAIRSGRLQAMPSEYLVRDGGSDEPG